MTRNNHSVSLGFAMLLLAVTTAYAQRPSIAALQAQITGLQAQVSAGTIPCTGGPCTVGNVVTLDVSTPSRPRLLVNGANLQVQNGLGSTGTINGVGNVIIGYNESAVSIPAMCSLIGYADQTSCQGHNGTWAVDQKVGSHNLVMGNSNRYIGTGGLLGGAYNTLANNNASVFGGTENTAFGAFSTVSGGNGNTASGYEASVSSGQANTASGDYSSVSGGDYNTASSRGASITGGQGNTASGDYSTVSGGIGISLGTLSGWQGGSLHSP